MNDVQTIVLGEDHKKQVANARKILSLGFLHGVVAVCRQCNRVEEYTLDEAAERMAARTWPYCHERRMVMDDIANTPQF